MSSESSGSKGLEIASLAKESYRSLDVIGIHEVRDRGTIGHDTYDYPAIERAER